MLLVGGSKVLAGGVVLRVGGSKVRAGDSLLDGVLRLLLLDGVYSLLSEGVNTLLITFPTPVFSRVGAAGVRESNDLTGAEGLFLMTPVLFPGVIFLGVAGAG